jgi:hypothetical protein
MSPNEAALSPAGPPGSRSRCLREVRHRFESSTAAERSRGRAPIRGIRT